MCRFSWIILQEGIRSRIEWLFYSADILGSGCFQSIVFGLRSSFRAIGIEHVLLLLSNNFYVYLFFVIIVIYFLLKMTYLTGSQRT